MIVMICNLSSVYRVTQDEDDGGRMPLPSEWYEDHLVIEDQKEGEDEFLVDALYLTKAQTLACKAGNKICFETKHLGAMQEHRERLHPFLEQRFPVEVWRDLLPRVFLGEKEESMELLLSSAESSTRGKPPPVSEVPTSRLQTSAFEAEAR